MENNNTQLPAEVVHSIWREAEKYTEVKVKAINEEHFRVYDAYIAGATEYASKLHMVNDEIDHKDNEIERLRRIVSKHKSGRTYQEQKEIIENMRTLLEKVIYRHEGGLLPDRLLYNEIKTFLK